MSSFNDYFERDNINEIQFEADSFYPILETIIILFIIYFSYNLYSSIKSPDSKYQNSEYYIICQCDSCKKRLKRIIKKNHKSKHIRAYIIAILFLLYFAKKYYDIILKNQLKIKTFDPYEILGVSSLSDKKEIKKAYKHLALLYHPDKNLDDINAKNKFMLINKAYETLINDDSRKKYELYGNPDGPTTMRISLGIPSFILNKKNHIFILIIFIISICLIIPYNFLKWYNKTSNIGENGLFNKTREHFKKSTNLNTTLLNYPFILGISEEFDLIPEPHIRAESVEIDNLYNKYKNIFKNKEVLENLALRLSLNKKKAIGIAYEYCFCDKTDKNYLKLHKVNEYIILLSKLLNLFIDCQKEKLIDLKILSRQKETQIESDILKELLELQPIKPDLIYSSIIYQQCFYQGIPIFLMNDKFIQYTQLPHISLKNYKSLKDKDADITFEQFLNYGDEGKKTIMEKVFNFNKLEIKDILESTKAIPRYEYKIKTYVDGYEDTGFLKGDKVTFKIDIIRKNEEDKKMGVQHSKYFPGLFNEYIYILVSNNKNLIRLDKILIDKKNNEYKFGIYMASAGMIPIKILLMSATSFQNNGVIDCKIKVFEKSEKREEMIKSIESKNKEKIKPSFIQRYFFNYQDSSDDEEEEDENKENNKKKEIEDNENINNIEINKDIENIENELNDK